jgi:uncharacterized protein (DUF1810 family)
VNRTLPVDLDDFDLDRFLMAQRSAYAAALAELKQGRKRSHWMWFVFPQMRGLGSSLMAQRYAIGCPEEAAAYLQHPVLGPRLADCVAAVLKHAGKTPSEIFGYPDDLKFKSSMTLFATAAGPGSAFRTAIDRFFDGQSDEKTLALIRGSNA